MPNDEKRGRGFSKADWLEAALSMIRSGSAKDLKVEAVAKELGVSKSGFYWHFRDRDELLRELLDYWSKEFTEVVTRNVEVQAMEPKKRLVTIAQMVLEYGFGELDMAIRLWARSDETASQAVRDVNRDRLEFARAAFAELGFEGEDLEMRTMLFVCYHTWESSMFPEYAGEQLGKLIERRINFLTS